MKPEVMQKTVVVWFCALICCLLWGSAFPCVKIGYQLFKIGASDSVSQIMFAGIRFFIAKSLKFLRFRHLSAIMRKYPSWVHMPWHIRPNQITVLIY